MKRAALFCALPLCAATPGRAQVVSVTPQTAPRDFGYFTGDLLAGTARIVVAPGTVLDAQTLPVAGPVAPSIDIRGVRVERSGLTYTVRVTYQSFEAPERVARFAVPPYTLGFSGARSRYEAVIPGFSFTASAFRNDLTPVLDASVLRPDPDVSVPDATGLWRVLLAGTAMCAIAGGVLWWDMAARGWRRRGPAPFASAARRIASMNRNPAAGDAEQALVQLHRAFDATAGARLFADDLDMFFARHERFAGLRAEVAQLYASSRSVFFGAQGGQAALSLGDLAKLARALMLAERLR